MEENLQITNTGKEELVFNIQYSVVMVEHLRLISRALKVQHGVTLNEYCILVFLDALEKKISSTELAQYLMYNHNTLLFILTSLEDAGFIYKETNQDDKRAMFVSITHQGQSLAHALARSVKKMMQMTFWRSLSVKDYLAPLKEMEDQLDNMRGFSMDAVLVSREALGLTHVLLFRVISSVVATWTKVAKECSGLAFNDCRTLLLLELYGQLSPREISRRLHIARSGISLSLDRLASRRLVEFLNDPKDGRSKFYRCTALGLRSSHELLHELRRATIEAYKNYSNESIITLNVQHMHMYSDLYQIESVVQTIVTE